MYDNSCFFENVNESSMMELLQDKLSFLNEPALLKEIAMTGKSRFLKKGDLLVNYGEPVQAVPLVLSGSFKVMREDEHGNELFLFFLGESELCTALLKHCVKSLPSELKIVVEEDVEFIALQPSQVCDWISQYSTWCHFVFESYGRQFSEVLQAMDQVAFAKIEQRIHQYLRLKASQHQKTIIWATHHEIARDLNTSRETISRGLKKLETAGAIKLGRNRIKLLVK